VDGAPIDITDEGERGQQASYRRATHLLIDRTIAYASAQMSKCFDL
jgi:hypothetical protein